MKICYGGRFHPPHKGHYLVYKEAEKKFGKVYVLSSDSRGNNSPFSFEEKKMIWDRMFGVELIYSKNPCFCPSEIVSDGEEYVTICGHKDVSRYIDKKSFVEYGSDNKVFFPQGYYYVVEEQSNGLSATYIRNNIKYNKELFVKVYGKFDQEIFDLFNERL